MKKLFKLVVAVGDVIMSAIIVAGAMYWGETPAGAVKIAARVMTDPRPAK